MSEIPVAPRLQHRTVERVTTTRSARHAEGSGSAGLTPAELAESLDVPIGTARQVLEDFERDGIAVEADGHWRLTKRGRDLARGLRVEGEADA